MRSIVGLFLLLVAAPAWAQPSPQQCQQTPRYFGCLPPAAPPARANRVPLSVPGGDRSTSIGEMFDLFQRDGAGIAAALAAGNIVLPAARSPTGPNGFLLLDAAGKFPLATIPTGPNGIPLLDAAGKLPTATIPTGPLGTQVRVNIMGDQGLTVAPTGNPAATLSSLNVQGPAISPDKREFMVNLGMTSNVGQGTPGADKVTLYTGMVCNAGSSDCWSQNPVIILNAGFTGNGQGSELDFNTFAGPRTIETGPLAGALSITGFAGPGSYGTHAILIRSAGINPLVNDAVIFDGPPGGSVVRANILDRAGGGQFSYLNLSPHSVAWMQDRGVAPTGIVLAGTYPAAAINTSASISPRALLIGNGQAIRSSNAARNGDLVLVSADAGNNVHIGAGAAQTIVDGPLGIVGPLVIPASAPASSTAPCQVGTFSFDLSFHYQCVAPNTWKRAALSSW